MELEKKKAKKIAEQKKALDARLDQEMKRNTELQKEMYRWSLSALSTLLRDLAVYVKTMLKQRLL